MLPFNIPWKWFIGAGAILLLLALAMCALDQAEDKGKAKQQVKQLEHTIKQVEKKDEVEKTFDADAQRVYDQCVRSARTPENCKRLLPLGHPVGD